MHNINNAVAVKPVLVGSEEEGGGGGALVEVPRVQVDTSLPSWNISAIIPTCNRLHSLQDAIESALKQTYPVLEVIVPIDSGPDCVKSIKNIWESKDDRVRVFKVPPCPQPPCGVGRSRNYAIEKASPYATHFALLDDDDLWYPHKTEIQVKTMQEGNYSYSSSDANIPRNVRCHGIGILASEYKSHDLGKGAYFRSPDKGYVLKKLNLPLDAKLPSHVTRKELRAFNFFVASATIFSKDIFYATSGFDTRIDGKEDYRMWLKFTTISPGLYIRDPLVVYDNNRNGCDVTYTSDILDVPPEIKLQLQQQQQQILEELNVKFCGSNMWRVSGISCENRAQFLISTYRLSEQKAKSSLLDSGCQCNALGMETEEVKKKNTSPPNNTT